MDGFIEILPVQGEITMVPLVPLMGLEKRRIIG